MVPKIGDTVYCGFSEGPAIISLQTQSQVNKLGRVQINEIVLKNSLT